MDNCINCSLPTNLVGLKNLNTHVHPRGKAADYDDLQEISSFSRFNSMSKYSYYDTMTGYQM